MDLKHGYYQIPLDDSSKSLTAFSLDYEIWEFNRLPFGLTNAPYSFQKAMSIHFGSFKFIKIYLDDLLIFSKSEQEHYDHLLQFFQKASEVGISINFKKSSFFVSEVKYLGLIINGKGTKADTSRIETIQEFKPKSKKEIQKYMGLIQWFRPFIKDLSFKTDFLSEKIKINLPFSWSSSDSLKLK